MKKVKIQISWIKPKAKSGHPIITKLPYRPIIVFENQYIGDWKTHPLFCAEIFNEKIDKSISIATLELKADNAPVEYLKKGNKFELYESFTKVADGIVIEE